MSGQKEPSFGVKALNSSSVANFSSTEDDSYILIVANNCNTPVDNGNSYDNAYNNNNRAALFGVNLLETTHNQEAYIGIRNNNLARKIAKFNSDCINLDVNTVINGNILPSASSLFDLGSSSEKWNSLYLNDRLVANKIIGDGYDITNLNLNRYDTSYLKEGTNLYWTQERFDESLRQISLDNINQGSSNTSITNNTFNGNLVVDGLLSVKSLFIEDFEQFQQDNPAFSNIELTYKITQVIAKNTSVVPEGSNLYFTNKRVQDIVDVTKNTLQSEIDTTYRELKDYVNSKNNTTTSQSTNKINNLEKEIINTSNELYNEISNKSNKLYNEINNTSNILYNEIFNTSNKLYNEIIDTSNKLYGELINTSNFFVNEISSNKLFLRKEIEDRTKEIYDFIDNKELDVTGTAESIIKNTLQPFRILITDGNGKATVNNVTVNELNSLRNIQGNIKETFASLRGDIESLTLDQIQQGNSSKSIIDNIYDDDLTINGTLNVSNLNIFGSTNSIDTTVLNADQVVIENINSVIPSVKINHTSLTPLTNMIEIKNDLIPVFYITYNNRIGVGKKNPGSLLDVNGTITGNIFKGSGELLNNVFLDDRSTTHLKEGQNLYFTKQRVNDEINLASCDRILQGTSNKFIINNEYKDNLRISGNLLDVNGTISGNIFKGSGELLSNVSLDDKLTTHLKEGKNLYFTKQRVNHEINLASCDRFLQGTSNKFIINNEYKDNLTIEGGLSADYLYLNGVKFTGSNYVPVLHIDNMVDGTSNKMIINNLYDNDLKVNGTLEANNLLIHNNISLINNSIYSSECLDIMNYTDSPSINILQIGSGDILKIQNDYNNLFVMKNNGFLGNVDDPLYNIDISGTIQSSYFKGNGQFLSNVNIGDNNTNELKEGTCNLYFTKERVYEILFSSNYYSSNPFTPYMDQVYDNTLYEINKLEKAIYGIDLDHVVQGSNNKYIVNNIYNDSLLIDGTLTVRQIKIIDDDIDYQKIYNDSLYSYPNSAFNFTFDYTNISNVVVDIMSHTVIQQNGNGIPNEKIIDLENQINELQTNFAVFNTELSKVQNEITNVVSLDKIVQGTSNKFIQNGLYTGSFFIEGDLTVKNINIIDDTEIPVIMPNSPGTVSSQTINQSLEGFLQKKNFEKQINDVFETLSHAMELQNTTLVQKLNNITNDLVNIKTALNLQ